MSIMLTSSRVTSPAPGGGGTALRARALRGLRVASIGTAGKTLVDLGTQLVLLRLLAPEYFGVFAMAQALSGFVATLGDMAGQKFIVQRQQISERLVSTVFWFELSMGLLVAGLWAALCVPVLGALGRPEQIPFAWGLCVWIVAERLLLPRSLLERQMEFTAVNIALFAGVVAGSGAMLAGALMGGGAWVFVMGLVVRTLVAAALVWRAARFVPLWVFDRKTLRELLPFGAPLLVATALAFAATNVDYLVIGSLAGYSLLGLYYAAYRYPHYMNQFNIVLSSVVFPSFSRATDAAHLGRGLRLLTRYAALFAFVPVWMMWTEGEWLLLVLLGEKWMGALFAFQVFTTLAAMRLVFSHWGHVLVSRGTTWPVMLSSAASLPLVATAAWAGIAWHGIEGAAVGVAVVSLTVLLVCCAVFVRRVVPGFRYLEALLPALVALGAALGVWFALGFVDGVAPWMTLLAGATAYGAVAVAWCGAEMRRVMG